MENQSHITKIRQFRAHATSIKCTALGAKSVQVFATGGMNKSIKIWKTLSAQDAVLTLQSHYVPEKLTFDIEEEILLAGYQGGHLQLYDLSQGKMLKEHHGAHHTTISSVSFYPFANYYASAESKGATVKIWDMRKKNNLQTYKQGLSPITITKFSPDGQWLVTGEENGSIKVWELTAGKLLKDIKAHDSAVISFEFHPNDFLLASVSKMGDIKFWDLENFNLISSSAKTTSTGEAQVISFNQSGKLLLSGTTSHLNCYTYEPTVQVKKSTEASWRIIDDMVLHRGLESTFTISRGLKEGYVSVYKIKNHEFEIEIEALQKALLGDTIEAEVVDAVGDQQNESDTESQVSDVTEELSLIKSTNDETKKMLSEIRSARFDEDKKYRERDHEYEPSKEDEIDEYNSADDEEEENLETPTPVPENAPNPISKEFSDSLGLNKQKKIPQKSHEQTDFMKSEKEQAKPSQNIEEPQKAQKKQREMEELRAKQKAKRQEQKRKRMKEKLKDEKSSPLVFDRAEYCDKLMLTHNSVMGVLTERRHTFDVVRGLWHDGNHIASLDRLSKHHGDLALLLDTTDNLLVSPQLNFFNVQLFSRIIPLIGRVFGTSFSSSHALLYQDFVERALRQLQVIMNQIMPKINIILKHRSPNVHSAEHKHLLRCRTHLQRCGQKAKILLKSSKLEERSKEIIDRLLAL